MNADGVIRDHDVITNVQMIVDNGVIIVPPHDFAHPSRRYIPYIENKKVRV
jgi:hypothetical protein